MITEDLSVFFNDFGVTVVWSSVTGKGILDAPTNVMGGGMVLSNEYLLTVKTAEFGGAMYGDLMTVNSVSYNVREARQVDDGVLTEILLSKV
jgi:hypothetical protein